MVVYQFLWIDLNQTGMWVATPRKLKLHHGESAFAFAESQGLWQVWDDFRPFRGHKFNLGISGSAHLITVDSHILKKSRDKLYILYMIILYIWYLFYSTLNLPCWDSWMAHWLSFCLWLRAWSWSPGSPTQGSLHGACFFLCLCLCLSLYVSHE